MNLKHLRLISLVILILFCLAPVMAQDAEATAPALPTDTITVVSGEGEGNTIVNVGGETPTEEGDDPLEVPTEPMPWWAVAGLEIGKLVALYLVVVRGVRELVKAFLADPRRVAAAENAANLVRSITPDALEEAARIGAQKAYAETRELMDDLRRAVIAVTDGVPESSKVTPAPTSSVSSTGADYHSTTPPMPGR